VAAMQPLGTNSLRANSSFPWKMEQARVVFCQAHQPLLAVPTISSLCQATVTVAARGRGCTHVTSLGGSSAADILLSVVTFDTGLSHDSWSIDFDLGPTDDFPSTPTLSICELDCRLGPSFTSPPRSLVLDLRLNDSSTNAMLTTERRCPGFDFAQFGSLPLPLLRFTCSSPP